MTDRLFEHRTLAITGEDLLDPSEVRTLQRVAGSGVERLRRGVYAHGERWAQTDAVGRQRLRIHAVAATRQLQPVFGYESAAVLWGIPVRQPETLPVHTVVLSASAGRSKNGVVVHRQLLGSDHIQEIDGLLVTTPTRTVLDLARTLPFREAVVALDFVLHPRRPQRFLPLSQDLLLDELERTGNGRGRARAARAIAFARSGADNPGESISRVVIYELGFAIPALQVRHRNPRGGSYFTDTEWLEFHVIGEFDGKGKYLKDDYLRGMTSGEAVYEENVAGWYLLAAQAMEKNSAIRCGLVSTSSITQGEQAAILWRPLLRAGVHINFAHRSFIWENESRGQAAVHCVIIGFSMTAQRTKRLYNYPTGRGEGVEEAAPAINPYLLPGDEYVVGNRQTQISDQRRMAFGNMAADKGGLILSEDQRAELIASNPDTEAWIRPFVGAEEFINGRKRYCLWLEGITDDQLRAFGVIHQRVEAVRAVREGSSRPKLAAIPHLFAQITQRPNESFLLVPRVSSEQRRYVPMGFFEKGSVAADSCLVIEGATLFDFGILTSQMHMDWLRTVGGRLKSDYRYSKDVVYNNFTFPQTSEHQQAQVASLAREVLDARASDATLATLYDANTMPTNLRAAHEALDKYVDSLYQDASFTSARERVVLLLAMHRRHEEGRLRS